MEIYEDESRPLLDYYGKDLIMNIDAAQSPVDVLAEIVKVLAEDRRNHFGEEGFSAVT